MIGIYQVWISEDNSGLSNRSAKKVSTVIRNKQALNWIISLKLHLKIYQDVVDLTFRKINYSIVKK